MIDYKQDSSFWNFTIVFNFSQPPITCLKAHFKVWGNFDYWKPFKNDKKCFLFHL